MVLKARRRQKFWILKLKKIEGSGFPEGGFSERGDQKTINFENRNFSRGGGDSQEIPPPDNLCKKIMLAKDPLRKKKDLNASLVRSNPNIIKIILTNISKNTKKTWEGILSIINN